MTLRYQTTVSRQRMSYHGFYKRLFAPLETSLGQFDRDTISPIVGFDMGGPLSFRTIGRERGDRLITYVSCELAVRCDQQPSEFGNYELLTTCDNEQWVRTIVSNIGQMSLETTLGSGHTLDIGAWVPPGAIIQGVAFEKAYAAPIDGRPYGLLRVIGITRPEIEYALAAGPSALLAELITGGVYPNTEVTRMSLCDRSKGNP